MLQIVIAIMQFVPFSIEWKSVCKWDHTNVITNRQNKLLDCKEMSTISARTMMEKGF